MVAENETLCDVVRLTPISENKPINVSIVFDHSGSMAEELSSLFDRYGNPLFQINSYGGITYPRGYSAPIQHAKSAVIRFISAFNTSKDQVAFTAFSSTVDSEVQLTQNVNELTKVVEALEPSGGTALYDAMFRGLTMIEKAEGVNVLVVLTDGQDNMSALKWNEVVEKAVALNAPVYIIGLGDVEEDILKVISQKTSGGFYKAKTSSSLTAVYEEIGKKIQAFYDLVYTSSNLKSIDSLREVSLSFDMDSLYARTDSKRFSLPEEVRTYLEVKEQQTRNLMHGLGIASVAIATTTVFIYRRRKKNNI